MLAESFLLSGQRSSARGCLRRAQRLRRRAAQEPKALQRSSTELFVDFKERELARRAALIRERLRAPAITKALLLHHMARLLALPKTDPGPYELCCELKRSFGLDVLCDEPQVKQLLARLQPIVEHAGGWRLGEVFERQGPLKLELGSGEGEWVCQQAAKDEANWVCVEQRRDRVFRTLARSVLSGVANLCLVAGDAAQLLRLLEASSVDHIFVNFPEPPVRRGQGDAVGHLLTAETFKSIHRALKADGVLLVHSDNVTYLRQLAESIGALRCFRDADASGESDLTVAGGETSSVTVWRGRPGYKAGIADLEASSYFDRLWSNGRFTKRYFIWLHATKTGAAGAFRVAARDEMASFDAPLSPRWLNPMA